MWGLLARGCSSERCCEPSCVSSVQTEIQIGQRSFGWPQLAARDHSDEAPGRCGQRPSGAHTTAGLSAWPHEAGWQERERRVLGGRRRPTSSRCCPAGAGCQQARGWEGQELSQPPVDGTQTPQGSSGQGPRGATSPGVVVTPGEGDSRLWSQLGQDKPHSAL